MTGGMLLLTVAAVLVYCGLLQRVLDRMYLRDRTALILIGLMLLGTFMPPIRLGMAALNIGGGLIPLGVCLYLFIRADEAHERWRTILGSLLTGTAVYALTLLLPSEPEKLRVDPTLICCLLGGVIAWLLGRSRRGAFICGVTGMILADIVTACVNWSKGISQMLVIGGAGIADAAVISGVLGVAVCELIGEITERIVRARGGKRA